MAIDLFHRKHPRFLDDTIKWLPKFIPDSEIRDAGGGTRQAEMAELLRSLGAAE